MENRPPRGRARGRSRISTQALVDLDTTPPLGPPPTDPYQGMVVVEGNGGNGNDGQDQSSPNGNGGNVRRRSSSDEEMPSQQRALGESFKIFLYPYIVYVLPFRSVICIIF